MKSECNDILCNWKMIFQASDGKRNYFLDLLNINFNIIKPFYAKKGPWLQLFEHSNSLCVQATKAITNHAPICEYRLRFFSKKEFKCPYGSYPIELQNYAIRL